VHAALLLRTVAAFEPATALASRSTRLRRGLWLASLRGHERCFASATDKSEDTKDEADVMVDVKLPSNDDEDGKLLRIRHSAAHVMAMAVQKLFKDTKVSIGPWIEKGFYYDFDPPEPFVEKDLRRIKKEMDRIISVNPTPHAAQRRSTAHAAMAHSA
jgi:threonyl-tRNA synthetase